MSKLEIEKPEVKAIIDECLKRMDVSLDTLAFILKVSSSTLRGYKSKGYLPMPIFTKLKSLIESGFTVEVGSLPGNPLSGVDTERLVDALEKRGWIVELRRSVVENHLLDDVIKKS